jgi:nucleotide-binding universal stress UspA family protein
MKKIKNMLIPTDFAAKKNGILPYIKDLAQALNAQITALNINDDFLKTMTKADEIELQKNIEILFNSATDDHNQKVKIPVKVKIIRRPFQKFMPSKKGDIWVINQSNLAFSLSKLIHLKHFESAPTANCPVLLVPHNAIWSPIERILFANDIDSITPAMVRTISDFAEQFDAVVHLVHVAQNKKDADELTEKKWTDIYQKAAASSPFILHKIKGSNTVQSLKKYVQKHRINLATFVNKQRHFWQELIHPKMTQNTAFSTGLPTMIMHCNSLSQKTILSGKMNQMFNGYTMEGENHFS